MADAEAAFIAIHGPPNVCGDCGRTEPIWVLEGKLKYAETFCFFETDGKRYCDPCRDSWPDKFFPPEKP